MINQYALSLRLLDYAKAEKLEEKSPYKEAIESSRKVVLIQAALNEGSIKVLVTPDEQKKFYESNKDRYTEAKVQIIYLGFVADPKGAAQTNSDKKYRYHSQTRPKRSSRKSARKSRPATISSAW